MSVVEGRYDELAEFDLTEEEIDAMMAVGEPVELVGPPVDQLRFELVQEGVGHFGWRLSLLDGRVVARSESYASKAAAERAVRAVRHAAGAALVDRTAG